MSKRSETESPSTGTDVHQRLVTLFASPDSPSDTDAGGPAPGADEVPESDEARAGAVKTPPPESASDDATAASAEQPDAATDEDTPAPPKTYKVKVDGEELEVTLDELLRGYSRQADYTRKTQKHAEERKQFEAERAAVRAERDKYAAGLKQVEELLAELVPQEPDWDALRQKLPPDQFTDVWVNWQRHKDQREKLKQEREALERQQRDEALKAYADRVQTERDRLFEAFPEWRDPKRFQEVQAKLTEFAVSKGFSLDELAQTIDHRAITVLWEAMQYHELKAKQARVRAKVTETIKTAPPGGAAPTTTPESPEQRARKRLAETGSLDAATEVLLYRFQG